MDSPKVIYEDDGLVAVAKPAGLLVHAAPVRADNERFGQPTLVDWLRENYPEVGKVGDDPEIRPGLVHRLDKDTSGIMIIARRQEDFEYLKNLFKTKNIQKTYLALGWGHAKKDRGAITAPIGIKSGSTKRSVRSSKMVKPAETDYEVLGRAQAPEDESALTSLFEVLPRTGRTHQIRVHLASIEHPIVGDSIYGPRKPRLIAPRLMLHALAIEFERRPGERLSLEAAPDETFSAFLVRCGYPQGNYDYGV